MMWSTGKIVTVVSQGDTLLDGAFVSVTSDGMGSHGRSSNGKASLTAEADSMVTITVHNRGLRPQTKVVRLSTHKMRTRVKLEERAIDKPSKESVQHTSEGRPYLNENQKEIEKAKEPFESISEESNDPQSVYRSVLFAHQSLCTALGSIDRAIAQKPAREPNTTSQVAALEADIEALEAYADLLSSHLETLVEASNLIEADKGSIQNALSTNELEQVREFVADFTELPTVGKTDSLNGEPLAQFGEFVAGWVENSDNLEESPTALLEEVEQIGDELDQVPSHEDIRSKGKYDPNTYYNQFGSWSDVIKASDIDHRKAFLDDVRSVGQKLDKRPTLAEYDVHGTYAPSRLKREFGTWNKTLTAVADDGKRRAASSDGGMPEDERQEKMLSVIVELHDELGRVPKASHLPEDAPFDRRDYLNRFGGWYDAVEATELDYRAELLQDIRDVANTLGHQPDTVEMDEYGQYDHTDVYQFFDTWREAKETAMEDTETNEQSENESTDNRSEQATPDDEEERMLSIIVNLQDELGRVPKASHLPEDAPFIPQDYIDQFGGWYDALERAGLDHRGEVLQEIRNVEAELGRSPTTSELSEHGRYDSGDVYRHFDTWNEAKVAAGIDELDNESTEDTPTSTGQNSQNDAVAEVETDGEEELLEAVQSVARTLGRVPSLSEVDTHSKYDYNDVYTRFNSWGELKRLAGISTEAEVAELLDTESNESTDDSDETELPSSKLAELYEVFRRLGRAVDGIVEATDELVQESPMAAWRDALDQFVQNGADDWEDGYGPQQGNKSEIKINEYRRVYGNGEQVTEFQEIETAPVDPVIETILDRLEIDEHVQSLRLPVAPNSEVGLPIFVESEQELETAEALLVEFPEKPAIDNWEWVSSSEGIASDDGRDTDDRSTGHTPRETLKEVKGVEGPEADSLYKAGFESIEDLQEATIDEIAETDGISRQIVLRIKADVGGN